MNKTKIFKSLKHFLAVLKPMSWKQRIAHIFSYYEEIFFVTAIILVVITFVSIVVGKDDKEVIFGGGFANVDINQVGYEYLSDGVLNLLDGDPQTQRIDLSSTAFKEVTKVSELDSSYNAAMKLIAKIEEGTLDYIVMNEEALKFYMTQYALMDLTEIFTEDELTAMEDDLIYVYLEVEAVRYPIAVEVTQLPFIQDCVDVSEPVYFGFTGLKEDREEYRAFWAYINAWNPAS